MILSVLLLASPLLLPVDANSYNEKLRLQEQHEWQENQDRDYRQYRREWEQAGERQRREEERREEIQQDRHRHRHHHYENDDDNDDDD